jgi:ketosteroid isomerase-like protein
MSELNKSVLTRANAAVTAGDNEGFLACCTEDIVWSTVGGDTLHGKAAVRAWMTQAYVQPPDFSVHTLIADGDFVAALGDIACTEDDGKSVTYAYCDVWRLRDGKLAELRAFVIPAST